MAELLLELFSEEIPARMQVPAAANLEALVKKGLQERGIDIDAAAVTSFSGPRRIGLIVEGLPAEEPRRTVRRRGPRVDAPEKALAGFRRSLEGSEHTLETVEEKKGTFHLAVVEEGGAPIAEVVAAVVSPILLRFPWPKSMRWGDGDARWVRPLERILCIVDGARVPFVFAGLKASNLTAGHRFMAPAPFAVDSAAGHATGLTRAFVLRDRAERRRRIEASAAALAADQGLRVRLDPGLLDELAGLAEWPVTLLGRIDDAFMSLPAEVLTTSMRSHQKYLALEAADGTLAPFFVVVANLEAPDGGAAIVAGNERVLRARLWDARFFWDSDLRGRLEGRQADLERMVFHAKLGSMAAKAGRLERLAQALAAAFDLGDPADAARAGRLAKTDLVTGMVGEFPELQGVMGGYYARNQGEVAAVVAAIADHYSPQGPGDACPTSPTTVAVALADKLDSLVGFVAAGERATGSSDALGLRRLALGILRLVIDNDLRVSLRDLFERALDGYGDTLAGADRKEVVAGLFGFTADRLKVHLRELGVGHDTVSAVFAATDDDDPIRIGARVHAVQNFLESADGANLLVAHRRARNIVRIEAKKDGAPIAGDLAPDLLADPAERDLAAAMQKVLPAIKSALLDERFADAMAGLASLRSPVDRFFEDVLVNAEDPKIRANRLRLLAALGGVLDEVAAFDLVE